MSIFLDAHVHVYPDFPVEQLLDAALENFIQAATSIGETEPRDYVLCFTESAGLNAFSLLQKIADSTGPLTADLSLPTPGTWQYCAASENHCVIARNSDGVMIFILAGRQLISSEQVELLSLCAPVNLPDNTFLLEELARKVWDDGGIPLLPWGVGKWLGTRGAEIERFIRTDRDYPVVLGDNGNRPVFWPYPNQLTVASRINISVVSGSDPLPLPGHHVRTGSYGGWVPHRHLDTNCPVTDIKSMITQPGCVTPFGTNATVFQFFRDQFLVNVRKRLPNLLRES
jgi:hypothetical protein